MLQHKYLPHAHVSTRHTIDINASLDQVFPIAETLNFKKSRIIYWLFRLRGIPAGRNLNFQDLEKINFIRLESIVQQEITFGLIGQFWTPTGKLKKFKPEEFTAYNLPGYAKATWSFYFTKLNDFQTRIQTETRIFCPTAGTKRKFDFYWILIKPFSSLIRREILRAFKIQSEAK
jgi:hypothetical protein